MATLYKTNGRCKEVFPKNGTDFKLDELQGFVGGYIEIVPVLTGAPKGSVMVVNEEGKLMKLPINDIGTLMTGFTDVIVGDILVCNEGEIR